MIVVLVYAFFNVIIFWHLKNDNKSSLALSLQMPSVTTGDNAVHSSSPDLGSAPSDALKQVLVVIDKKVRNMEKKKVT